MHTGESSVLRMLSWPLVAAVAGSKRLRWNATAVANVLHKISIHYYTVIIVCMSCYTQYVVVT